SVAGFAEPVMADQGRRLGLQVAQVDLFPDAVVDAGDEVARPRGEDDVAAVGGDREAFRRFVPHRSRRPAGATDRDPGPRLQVADVADGVGGFGVAAARVFEVLDLRGEGDVAAVGGDRGGFGATAEDRARGAVDPVDQGGFAALQVTPVDVLFAQSFTRQG